MKAQLEDCQVRMPFVFLSGRWASLDYIGGKTHSVTKKE